MSTDVVPPKLLQFEYVANTVKLRYLEDCFRYPINVEAPYFRYLRDTPISEVKLVSDDGKAFQVYAKGSFYGGGKGTTTMGPLLVMPDSTAVEEVQQLRRTNRETYQELQQEANGGRIHWLRYFSEYVMVKTVIHELVTDTEEHEDDWGFNDLKAILNAAHGNREISPSMFRNLVVHSLRLGLDPAEAISIDTPLNNNFEDLSSLSYLSFLARRNDWVDHANQALAIICSHAPSRGIYHVMRWGDHAPCAYNSGPIFIRKEPAWLVPQISKAFESFSGVKDDKLTPGIFTDLLSPHLVFIIGSYWHHFSRGCEVDFFASHRERANDIPMLRMELDSRWADLRARASSIASTPFTNTFPKMRRMDDTREKTELGDSIDTIDYCWGTGPAGGLGVAPAPIAGARKPGLAHGPVQRREPRPEFQRLIELTRKNIPSWCSSKKTGPQNVRVYRAGWPRPDPDIHNEVDDWPEKKSFSVEIQFGDLYSDVAEQVYGKLKSTDNKIPGEPEVVCDRECSPGWTRLQRWYPDDTPGTVIVDSLINLIGETSPTVDEYLATNSKVKQRPHRSLSKRQ